RSAGDPARSPRRDRDRGRPVRTAAPQLLLPTRAVTSCAADTAMISRVRHTLMALLALGALALLPAGARGDADPPSDILLLQDVYTPFQPKVSATLQSQL